jgi:four helix bundle protein
MGHNFKNLKIWQKSMDLTDLVFDFVKDLPENERYGLISQMNRCSCSIPSNIAEGSGKRTNIHFAEFLSTALTSSFELETQLLICERRQYGNSNKLSECLALVIEIQKMIFTFRDHINNNHKMVS